MIKQLWKQSAYLFMLLCIYALISVYVYECSGIFIHRAIVWNVFLALLPFLFTTLFFTAYAHKKVWGMLLSFICWLLLFPNVPYLITDFIHISPLTFYLLQENGSFYVRELLPWLELLHLSSGIFLGIWSGYRSLHLLHVFAKEKMKTATCWLLVGVLCLVSSYGVYLGRFLRLNSWDILHPVSLLKTIVESNDAFSLQFTLVFFLFLFGTYCFYELCLQKKGKEDTEEISDLDALTEG